MDVYIYGLGFKSAQSAQAIREVEVDKPQGIDVYPASGRAPPEELPVVVVAPIHVDASELETVPAESSSQKPKPIEAELPKPMAVPVVVPIAPAPVSKTNQPRVIQRIRPADSAERPATKEETISHLQSWSQLTQEIFRAGIGVSITDARKIAAILIRLGLAYSKDRAVAIDMLLKEKTPHEIGIVDIKAMTGETSPASSPADDVCRGAIYGARNERLGFDKLSPDRMVVGGNTAASSPVGQQNDEPPEFSQVYCYRNDAEFIRATSVYLGDSGHGIELAGGHPEILTILRKRNQIVEVYPLRNLEGDPLLREERPYTGATPNNGNSSALGSRRRVSLRATAGSEAIFKDCFVAVAPRNDTVTSGS